MTVRAKPNEETGLFHLVDDVDGTVEEANAFLRALDIRGLSPRTVRAYAFDIVVLYRWMLATDRTLAGLVHADLLDFVRWEKERGAHPSSINRRLTVCRLLHGFHHPEGLGGAAGKSLPAPYYRGPGRDRRIGVHLLEKKRALALRVKTPKKQIAPLSAEQVCAFLQGLRRYRDNAIVHLMLLCGLRSREVLGLGRRDVSLVERRVRVIGKGDKERIVPLADLAAVSMEKYLKHERPRECVDDRLFVCLQGQMRGRAMTPEGLRSLFRGRRKGPDLACANPHRFRHTFGADMARSGMNVSVLQELMGHENIETTIGYINLSLSDVTEAYLEAVAKIQKAYDLE